MTQVAFSAVETPDPRPAWTVALSHLAALVVAGVFLWFAMPKITDARQFAVDIGNYRLLSRYASAWFAIVLPWWEIGASLALLWPGTRKAGAILIAGLLVMFIGAVGLAMSQGLDITCGCGGHGSGKAGWLTILRNTGLLAGTAIAVYFAPRRARA